MNNGISILGIEAACTLLVVAIAFCAPRLLSRAFSFIERLAGSLAVHKRYAPAFVGLTALVARLLLLPIRPIPDPYYADDFGFLFAADTFAHGRLTNPTPAMWAHFETLHITMRPTYASMFFPAQGVVLAAGQIFFGHPWYGQLLVTALMCSALYWALQAWLPPKWALLGGVLAVIRLGLFSLWIDTYTGAGSVAALGGALVVGSFPRWAKSQKLRYAAAFALGVVILLNSRPYEGLLLCLTATFTLVKTNRSETSFKPNRAAVIRSAILAFSILLLAGTWMGYYNYRNFGSVLTLPYTVDRATYAVAPHFIWGKENPVPHYLHPSMRDYYLNLELPEFRRLHSLSGFVPQNLLKVYGVFLFYAGIALLPPLIMVRRVFLDNRIRFMVICCVVAALGMLLLAGGRPYYLAPFTVVFYGIGLQAMRHLRVWKPEGRPVGLAILRSCIAICVALAIVEPLSKPLHISSSSVGAKSWICGCLESPQLGLDRAEILSSLERMPGKQLVLVRYGPTHDPVYEWVYNPANISDAKVLWAHEMGGTNDAELLRYYKDRKIWLVQPDAAPAKLEPYPIPTQIASANEHGQSD